MSTGRKLLKKENGEILKIDAGESATIVAYLRDAESGGPLLKGAIITLTWTLLNAADMTVINGRNAVSVKDANGGYLTDVTVDGINIVKLRLKLSSADNARISAAAGRDESHYGVLKWTWIDDDGDEREGAEEWEILIRDLASPAA